jgi:3-oxoacyl-[acyl-carrier protein] reductase
MEFKDASVLITGGSRGLGRALGKALAREGAAVVLNARSAGDLHDAVQFTP